MINAPGLPLPTDSLYKFLALVGLTVAVISFFVPLGMLVYNQDRMSALSVELAEVRADIESAKESQRALPTAPNDPARTRELLAVGADLRRRQAAAGAKLEAIHRLNRQAAHLMWLAFGGPAVGLAVSAVGFWLWYVRLQCHLDAHAREATRRQPRKPEAR